METEDAQVTEIERKREPSKFDDGLKERERERERRKSSNTKEKQTEQSVRGVGETEGDDNFTRRI